jgi:RimJ/RimL family protein N-acetyltransferase
MVLLLLEVSLRPATLADGPLLLEWRNDPLTRAMARNTAVVSWEDHSQWLSSRLSSRESGLYIAEDNGSAVGTLRVDGDRISYTVAPDFRHRGIATAMLRAAFVRFGPLVAEIKRTNDWSIRAATKAGHRVTLI